MVNAFKPKTKTKQWISCSEFDELVKSSYAKPYCFQQQDGCKERGTHHVTVPISNPKDYEKSTVSEVINGSDMGVGFAAWLDRDPTIWSGAQKDSSYINMFWERNFYPNVDMVLNDLYAKRLIEAGEYVIEIDW